MPDLRESESTSLAFGKVGITFAVPWNAQLTGLPTAGMEEVLPHFDGLGFWSVETLDGNIFDSCVRRHLEDPFDRLRRCAAALPKTPQQIFVSGLFLLGQVPQPADVVAAFAQGCADCGVRILRVYDGFNDVGNMRTLIRRASELGLHAQGSVLLGNPEVFGLADAVEMSLRLADVGCHSLCLLDLDGRLEASAAADLVGRLGKCGLPLKIGLQSLGAGGRLRPEVVTAAIGAGLALAVVSQPTDAAAVSAAVVAASMGAPSPAVMKGVYKMVEIEDEAAMHRFVAATPEICQAGAVRFLDKLIDDLRDSENPEIDSAARERALSRLRSRRSFLDLCVRQGVERAIEERRGAAGVPGDKPVTEDLPGVSDPEGFRAAHAVLMASRAPEMLPRRIAAAKVALELVDSGQNPQLWRSLQIILAEAFALLARRTGAPKAYGEALEAYGALLERFPPQEDPEQWAWWQGIWGDLCRNRRSGSPSEDQERAIEAMRRGLAAVDKVEHSKVWGALHYNLGDLFAQRIEGDRGENWERVIEACHRSLEVHTAAEDPDMWGRTHINLGLALKNREAGDRRANRARAIEILERAVRGLRGEESVELRARAQANLGGIYLEGLETERGANEDKAIEALENAAEHYGRDPRSQIFGNLQLRLGQLYASRESGSTRDDRGRAKAAFHRALAVYSREKDPLAWATIHGALGSLQDETSPDGLDRALAHFEAALDLENEGIRVALAPGLLMQKAAVLLESPSGDRAENIEGAYEAARSALELFESGDSEEEARARTLLATILARRQRGDRLRNLEDARDSCLKALEILRCEEHPSDWAKAQRVLGIVYNELAVGNQSADRNLAIRAFERALRVFTRDADPVNWAYVQLNLASAWRLLMDGDRRENVERAIQASQKALEVVQRDTDPESWALIHGNLCGTWTDRLDGDPTENIERAIEAGEKALEGYAECGRLEGSDAATINLAKAYSMRLGGDLADNQERAIELYRSALAIAPRASRPAAWATVQHNLASIYRERVKGDPEQNVERAIQCVRLALEVRGRDSYPTDWAISQSHLGNALRKRHGGDPEEGSREAISCYENALEVYTKEAYPEQWAHMHFNLAGTYASLRTGDLGVQGDKALAHAEAALEVTTRDRFPVFWAETQAIAGQARLQLGIGEEGSWKAAEAAFGEALEVYAADIFPAEHAAMQRSLGALFLARRDWARAHEHYARAVAATDHLFDEAFTFDGMVYRAGEQAEVYLDDAWCLLKLGRLGDALGRIEAGRARVLRRALGLEEITSRREESKALAAEARGLRYRLGRAGRGAREALSYRELSDRLRQAHRQLGALRAAEGAPPAEVSVEEITGLAPAGGALVVPLISSAGAAVILVPAATKPLSQEHVRELPFSRSDLRGLLDDEAGWLLAHRRFAAAVAAGEVGEDSMLERSKSIAAVLETLEDWLASEIRKGLRRLSVEPGAPVVLFPQAGLNLLPLQAAGEGSSLLEDYEISWSPSFQALAASAGRVEAANRHPQTLLEVLDPTENLPNALDEGAAVARHFKAGGVECLVGANATLPALLAAAGKSAYLHFACHGRYNSITPVDSYLALAGGQRLTLSQIMGEMDLRASRLVTLATCDSGLSDLGRAPEELVGLPVGFLQAGAPAVLCSLWMVQDLPTMLLMHRFYDAHLRLGESPAGALRKAQLWLRGVETEEVTDVLGQIAALRSREPAEASPLDAWKEGLQTGAEPTNARPFAGPEHWAGFVLYGL